MSFQFIKEQITNLFVIAKPALELFNKRLNVTANRGLKVTIAPLTVLATSHGRLEIARLHTAVEKMGFRGFPHTYGHHEAVNHTVTFPVLKARAHDKFSTTYIFLFKLLFLLFAKAVKYVEHTAVGEIALKLTNPVLRIVLIINSILCIIFGEENFTSTLSYFIALPNRIFNYIKSLIWKRVYLPCRARVKRTQKVSPFFAFVCKVMFYFYALMVFGISVILGFLSMYALDEVSLELIIQEQRSPAFIINVEKAGDPGDSSGEDTTITYGCDDRNSILKSMDAEDCTEILRSINRIDSVDGVIIEGSDADVEDNIEEHDALVDWEEEWEWAEVGRTILEEKVVWTKQNEIEVAEADTKLGMDDADCDAKGKSIGNTTNTDHEEVEQTMDVAGGVHEEEICLVDEQDSSRHVCDTVPRPSANDNIFDSEHLSLDCGENIADVDINQVLSFSNYFSENAISRDEKKVERVELSRLIDKDILFQEHEIVEASSCVTEEMHRFRRFRFHGGDTTPPMDYIVADNIIATTVEPSIDDITVNANDEDFGNHTMSPGKHEMDTFSSATKVAPIATVNPWSNEESTNNCAGDSGPESGTLVGLGLAQKGFIFSDSQDLKDIEEMEAENYYRVENQKTMYDHPKFSRSHSKASREDALVGMKSLSRAQRDFSNTSSLALSIFPLPSRVDTVPAYWATAPAMPRSRRVQRSRHISLADNSLTYRL